MTDIKHFLINKLPASAACAGSSPVLGSFGFSFTFDNHDGIINPAILYLNTPQSGAFQRKSPFFSIINQSLTPVFTNRLKQTPFYLSYLCTGHYVAYFLDFYDWTPDPVFYRLMHVEFSDTDLPVTIRLPAATTSENKGLLKANGTYFCYRGEGKHSINGQDLDITPDKNTQSLSLILALSPLAEPLNGISFESIRDTFLKLEAKAKSGHISNYFRTQNKVLNSQIEESWANIKGLTPDLFPDPYLLESESSCRITARWTAEIGCYLGLEQRCLKLTAGTDIFKDQSSSDSLHPGFYSLLRRAYWSDQVPSDQIIPGLQAWWNRYSRPAFDLKFEKMIENETEYLFIIYSLAQRYKLIWCADMLAKCRNFTINPELRLLALLHGMTRPDSNRKQSFFIYRGNLGGNNLIELKRGEYIFRYTTFSGKDYSEVKKQKRQLIKIDKEVNFEIDPGKNKVRISPSVLPLNEKDLTRSTLTVEVNDQILQIPLIWPKVSMIFSGFRVRWILKKDRFQLTCVAGKTVKDLKINGERIQIEAFRRIKLYLPVKRSEARGGLVLSDEQGRTAIIPGGPGTGQKLSLSGWIQGGYGTFVSFFNSLSSGGQSSYLVRQSGKIEQLVKSGHLQPSLHLVIKKSRLNLEVNWLTGKALGGFLSSSPRSGDRTLQVLVSHDLKDNLIKIKELLISNLGYLPQIFEWGDRSIVNTSAPLICLTGSENDNNNSLKFPLLLTIVLGGETRDIFSATLPL